MRVLSIGSMYPPHSLGGYEVIWESATRHLEASGHEVRVLCSDLRVDGVRDGDLIDVRRQLRWYLRDGVPMSPGPLSRIALERHNSDVLARELGDFRPDVVAWWAMGAMSLSLIEQVRREGLPAVGFVIDEWMGYGPKLDAWLRMCWRLRPFDRVLGRVVGVPPRVDLGASATWAFTSEHVRDHALSWGLDLTRSEILRPGVDASLFAEGPAPERDWDWRLLSIGRLDERKGHGVAVEAMRSLPGEATLRVAGAGDDHLGGRLAAAAEGVAPGRIEIGPVERPEVPATYAEADAVLFPVTWAEPWGLVPLEAMAMGRPVIATGTGGSGEYLVDGENCLLVAPGDAKALAAAVTRLADDRELRDRLRTGGLETAARHTDTRFNQRAEELLRLAGAQLPRG